MVRDQASFDFAAERFDCSVRLCPDLALCLGPQERPTPVVDVLCLFRTDRERAAPHALPATRLRVQVTDWLGERRLPVRLRELGAAAARLRSGPRRITALRVARYDAAAAARVARGCRLLSTGRMVVTDRLHAHLLSLLLGIPHAALDNTYGKLGRFLDAWTGDAPGVYRARTVEEALAWAETAK